MTKRHRPLGDSGPVQPSTKPHPCGPSPCYLSRTRYGTFPSRPLRAWRLDPAPTDQSESRPWPRPGLHPLVLLHYFMLQVLSLPSAPAHWWLASAGYWTLAAGRWLRDACVCGRVGPVGMGHGGICLVCSGPYRTCLGGQWGGTLYLFCLHLALTDRAGWEGGGGTHPRPWTPTHGRSTLQGTHVHDTHRHTHLRSLRPPALLLHSRRRAPFSVVTTGGPVQFSPVLSSPRPCHPCRPYAPLLSLSPSRCLLRTWTALFSLLSFPYRRLR